MPCLLLTSKLASFIFFKNKYFSLFDHCTTFNITTTTFNNTSFNLVLPIHSNKKEVYHNNKALNVVNSLSSLICVHFKKNTCLILKNTASFCFTQNGYGNWFIVHTKNYIYKHIPNSFLKEYYSKLLHTMKL